jgi:hypothetical protein
MESSNGASSPNVDISRRSVLVGAVAPGSLGYGGRGHAEDARPAAIALLQHP